MKALKVACVTIVCLASLYLLILPIAYLVDPFEVYEVTGWKILLPIVDSVLLILAATGTMLRKTYAWWLCQTLFLGNLVGGFIFQNPLMVFFLVWFIIFATTPPRKWDEGTLVNMGTETN